MTKFSKEQWIGLILIIAAILIWVPLGPLGFLKQIGPIAVVVVGIYQLFR